MPELFAPTLDDQIAEVKPEIAMRKRVYPRWVSDGKLTQAKMDRQIANMEAVLVTLESVARRYPGT